MSINNQDKSIEIKEPVESFGKVGVSASSDEVKKRYKRKHPIMQQGQSYHLESKNEILFSKTRE